MTQLLHPSPYEKRVGLVLDVVLAHTTLNDDSARDLAIQMLAAVDHLPERMR